MKAFPVEILTIIFEFVYLAASDASDDTPDRRAFPGSVYRPHGQEVVNTLVDRSDL